MKIERKNMLSEVTHLLKEGLLQLPSCRCPAGWRESHKGIHHSYCPLWQWDTAEHYIKKAIELLESK